MAFIDDDFHVGAVIGVSQAFSPNPDKPPYYADNPFRYGPYGLEPNPSAYRRWEANFLANRIDRYLAQPLRLGGLRFDAGFDDQFTHIPPTSRAFSAALGDRGVEHHFVMYNGDHRNRLWGRQGRLYTEVLPYFSSLLQADR